MFRFLLLLQLFVLVASRSRFAFDDEIFSDLFEMNDPNLNPGFDLNAWRDAQLDLHNYYRSLHGAPPMTRDETLTTKAQEYAETLAAQNGGLVHCNLPACDRQGAGENLAMASGSTSAEINATKAWYDEIWDYNFCFDANATTSTRPGHAGKAIGHFTQVVWEDSTQLGVGYARNTARNKVYIVARYLNHGNVVSRYSDNVKVPNYILDTFQNNCDGTNGGLSDWMGPGPCTRPCGGGVRFLHKTCTNPKPSLNGADCVGATKQIAAQEWCNTHTCPGTEHHRDLQCTARGFTSGRHHNFGGSNDCILHCFLPTGNVVSNAGNVDDGTHCNSGSGTCVSGACVDMPPYVPGNPPTTTEPETTTTEATTTVPETTTTQPETTTTQPETTTTQPETTTTEPETTTAQPETTTTTTQPETTTTEPETTTTEPDTTTTQPETTTTQPDTTTTQPETTTTQPETTTTEPETTTTEPETTTTEPDTTTTQPDTTTTQPETTTTQPETTTTQPETTTTEPKTTKPTTEAKITTISTTSTPSPTPRRRIVRGRLFLRIRPGQRPITFLTLSSGRYLITLRTFSRARFSYVYRVRRLGNTPRRWRLLRCRRSRCRRIRGRVGSGYQIEIAVYVHRCQRCRSSYPMLIRYLYRRL